MGVLSSKITLSQSVSTMIQYLVISSLVKKKKKLFKYPSKNHKVRAYMDNHISVSLPVQTSVIIPLSRGQRLAARASKEGGL